MRVSFLLSFILFVVVITSSAQGIQSTSIETEAAEAFNLRIIDSTKSFTSQFRYLEMARQKFAKEDMVVCYCFLSISCRRRLNVSQMQLYADSAFALAQQLNNPKALGYAFMARAYFESYIEEDKMALNDYITAFDNFEHTNNNAFASRVAAEISYCYSPIDETKCLKYASISEERAMKTGLADVILHARLAKGDCFFSHKKTKSDDKNAINYLRGTIDYVTRNEEKIYNKIDLGIAYVNMAVEYQSTGDLYFTPLLFEMINKALVIAKKYKSTTIYQHCLGIQGEYLMNAGEYDKAETLFLEGIKDQVHSQDYLSFTQFYTSLKKLAINRRDFKQYYLYDTAFERYNQLRYNSASLQESQNADARYETSLKVNTISNLESENKLQHSNKWLSYGAVLLMAIALLLMFRSYYFKQKYFIQTQNILKEKQLTTELQLQLKEQESIEALEQKLSMERRLLQSQMDPHFIFNALGNIQGFILQNDTQNAVSYLSRFSSLMRQILEQSKKESISISDEVNTLQNYIELQKLRLNNSFDYRITVAHNLNPEAVIPPMLIQPFIENAIEHGLKKINNNKHGLLELNFKQDDEQNKIICTVLDNGIGFEQSKLLKQNSTGLHKSMAMAITKERLHILLKHNPSTGFTLEEIKNERNEVTGTLATVTIPSLNIDDI